MTTYLDTLNKLPPIPQVTGSVYNENWTIDSGHLYNLGGSNMSALGLKFLPKGGLVLTAPSLTSVTPGTFSPAGYFLDATKKYDYALTLRTKWGETTIGAVSTATMAAGNNGVTVVVPVYTANTQNPAIERRLYRTGAYTGSSPMASPDFKLVKVIDESWRWEGPNTYTYIDGCPDGARGWPPEATNKSGVVNQVTVTGAAHGTWTEVLTAPAAGQFNVDYNNGTVNFNNADVGNAVTISYRASALVNDALFNDIISALQNLRLATLPKDTELIITPTVSESGAISIPAGYGSAPAVYTFPVKVYNAPSDVDVKFRLDIEWTAPNTTHAGTGAFAVTLQVDDATTPGSTAGEFGDWTMPNYIGKTIGQGTTPTIYTLANGEHRVYVFMRQGWMATADKITLTPYIQ